MTPIKGVTLNLLTQMDLLVSATSKIKLVIKASPNVSTFSPEKKNTIKLRQESVIGKKMTNKFIQIIFNARQMLDEVFLALNLAYEEFEIY